MTAHSNSGIEKIDMMPFFFPLEAPKRGAIYYMVMKLYFELIEGKQETHQECGSAALHPCQFYP